MYIISNGNQYLKTHSKLTSKVSEARKFPDYLLADKARKNMKNTFKKMGKWEIIEQVIPIHREKDSEYDRDVYTTNKKVITIKDVSKNLESISLAENITVSYKKLISYKAVMEKTIEECEKKIMDLLHFVEFYDVDMYNAYKIYKMIQDIRIQRRTAKDELVRINNFLKQGFESDIEISDTEKRSYSPRVLTKLFTEKKWKPHRERK